MSLPQENWSKDEYLDKLFELAKRKYDFESDVFDIDTIKEWLNEELEEIESYKDLDNLYEEIWDTLYMLINYYTWKYPANPKERIKFDKLYQLLVNALNEKDLQFTVDKFYKRNWFLDDEKIKTINNPDEKKKLIYRYWEKIKQEEK